MRTHFLGAAFAVGALCAQANAATVEATFDFTTLSGALASQLVLTSGGLTLTIDPHHYQNISDFMEPAVITASADDVMIGINANGIGVCEPNPPKTECKARDLLDGGSSKTDNELLKFSFDKLVSNVSIIWNNNDTNDLIDLFLDPALVLAAQFAAIAPPGDTQLVSAGPLTVFGIGVQERSDEIRIAGIRVSYEMPDDPSPVPLPAAGFLMLAGLGGLAALRRRKV